MRVITVHAEDAFALDKRVNREIARIEGSGGEVVNVSLAIHSKKFFCLYAMILFSDEVAE